MPANDVLIFPSPALTNQGLALGRILLVATNANVVQFNGGGFGSEGFPFTATLTDLQIASPLAFTTESTPHSRHRCQYSRSTLATVSS
jgi:hypothetical protein